jgi:hypothetical protein
MLDDSKLTYDMRKKRLAFGKAAFFASILTLWMLDQPTPLCILPILIGTIYNSLKLGTQVGFNMTPERFFLPRTYLTIYNIAFLCVVFYKFRQGRKEKLELEFSFYQRVESIMLRMSNVLED